MDEQRRELLITDCIERLQAGETVADCLAHYGAEAAAVAPLLNAAARLQRVRQFHLSANQRGQATAALRAAMISQNQRAIQPAKTGFWPLRLVWPWSVHRLALAGTLATMLFVAVIGSAVAFSQPGDAAYAVRVIVERAPLLLTTTTTTDRATAELRIADRRLADADQYLAATGQVEHNAVAALLRGDQAAANQAATAPQTERTAVAARVTAHADALTSMAATAVETQTRTALQTAAQQVRAIAAGLEPNPGRPGASPTALPMSPTPTPEMGGQPTPTVSGGNPQGTHTPQAAQTPQGMETQPAQGTHTPQRLQTAQPMQTPGYGQQPSATPKPAQTPGYGQQPTATPKPAQTPGYGQQPTATPKPAQTPGYGQQPTATPKPTQKPGYGQQPTATPQARRTATQAPGGGGSGR